MKFLLVEDDEVLARAIEQLLAEHHYVMDLATDGIVGRDMAETFPYDLILLDWMLPKLDGMQLCKYLRNEGNYTPIILMTARDASTDKVTGLDAGADDYLVKPFEFEELLARIRALLRRAEGIVSPVLQWGDLCLDPRSSEVTCRNIPVSVTPKEYALLELFLRNPSRIFSLDNLLDKVWSFEDSPNVGSVRTHIKGLRQKLKKAGLPDIITTVYGLGYRLKSEISQPTTALSGESGESGESAETGSEGSPTARADGSGVGKLDLSILWQGVSQKYLQRVVNVANKLRGLQPGLVDKAVQQQLIAEAHALAGSLGSFGFQSVTAQCREIESILDSNVYLSAEHVTRLETLIMQSQQTLVQGLGNTSAVSESALPESALSDSALSDSALSDSALSDSTLSDSALSHQIDSISISPESVVSLTSSAFMPMPISAELAPGQLFQLFMVEARGDRDHHWLHKLKTTAAHYQMNVQVMESFAQAREAIFPVEGTAGSLPHIVVFDFDGSHDLPANDSAEFELLAALQAAQPPIPSLVLTAADSFENRVRVARMGVAGLLQTPVTPTEVLETAARVLQKGAPPTAKLLIIDDDPAMLVLLQNLLKPWGFQMQLLNDSQQFWQTLERFDPDLVLLDVKIPQISGFDLCKVLRNAPRWHELPVLFMSGHTDADTIQRVFSVGADDYIRKPIVAPELIARVLGWLERSRTRQLRADVDNLTGVANRRKSTQSLNRLLGLAQRQGQTLCFALIDFDHFKEINDEYGHPVGDRVLKRFGESLRSTFRNEDVIGRWGGEEFVVGLYGISRQEGSQRLREFLKAWQQEQFDVTNGSDSHQDHSNQDNLIQQHTCRFHVTFTAGVAVYPHDATDLQGLYRAADGALYKAKAAGRNRIFSVA